MRAEVTFLGHSTVLVEMGGVRVLTDPVLFDRVNILRRAVSTLPAELYRDMTRWSSAICISTISTSSSLRLLG